MCLYIRPQRFLHQHKEEQLKIWFGDLCPFVECLSHVSYSTNAEMSVLKTLSVFILL